MQQPSATLSKYAFYSTCSFCLNHLYPTPSRNYLVFIRLVFAFFRSSYFGWRFFWLCSRTRYASAWFAHLDFLTRFDFSLSHCLWPQNLYLYDEESRRALGVLLMSLGRKNERFNVQFFVVHIKPFVLSTQRHQQYRQCPSWFFIVERYTFCGHSETEKNQTSLKNQGRQIKC